MGAASARAVDAIDLSDYELYRDGFPHDIFTTLRREAPVWRDPDTDILRDGGAGPFWVLSRHDDLRAVNRDTETFTAYHGAQIRDTADDRKGKMLISMDGPPHTRLRRLVSRGFTPKMIDTLEDHLRWRTERILDDVVGKGGEVDFVREVAEQLRLHVIADIIRIPEAERAPVFAGTNTILRAFDPNGSSSSLPQVPRRRATRSPTGCLRWSNTPRSSPGCVPTPP